MRICFGCGFPAKDTMAGPLTVSMTLMAEPQSFAL